MPNKARLPFVSIDAVGRAAGKRGQEYAKWVLDALRSFVIVAFFFYAAEKTNKWYVWAIAYVGFFALYLYLTSYIGQAQFNFARTKGWWDTLFKLFLMLVAFLVVGVFSIGSLATVQMMIQEISSVQAAK